MPVPVHAVKIEQPDILKVVTERVILLSVFALQETESMREIKTVELLMKLWSIIHENVQIPENTSGSKASSGFLREKAATAKKRHWE